MNLRHFTPLLLALAACSGTDSTARQTQGVQRIPCSTTVDCSARGGACNQGQCTADNECTADADCAANETCTADPNFGGLCATRGANPMPGPAWTCAADSDCPTAQVCQNGQCAPSTPPPPPPPPPVTACAQDSDCPQRLICDAGQCVAPQSSGCSHNQNCAPTEDCNSAGQCVPRTFSCDDGCRNGEVCDANNRCVAGNPCAVDTDCQAGEICRADRVCIPNPWACSTSADCERGYVCLNGECGPPDSHGCNGNNCPCDVLAQNCAHGMRCFPFGAANTDGQCYEPGPKQAGETCTEPPLNGPDGCDVGLVCLGPDLSTENGNCAALCAVDSDCSNGDVCQHFTNEQQTVTTEWGLCQAPTPPGPPPPCDPLASSCATGETCAPRDMTPSECVPAGTGAEGASCTSASDCGVGLACSAVVGQDPTQTYFTLSDAYVGRGGHCRVLCSPGTGATCSRTQDCSPILPSQTGAIRQDLGICD